MSANVVGLVYVAAFAPDEGERLGEVEAGSKDSVLNTALVPLQYPTGQVGQTAVEFAIDPAKFRAAFAADLPAEQAALMARPNARSRNPAFSEPSGPPAWKAVPSWAVVATGDKAAGSDVVRSMAQRAEPTSQRPGFSRDHDFPPGDHCLSDHASCRRSRSAGRRCALTPSP